MTENERRIAQRHRPLKAGKIIFNHGLSVIDCTVRNVSATGALIAVVNAATIQPEFELLFDGSIRPCVVAWRRLNALGVKFKA